ncbi:MAG: Mur ligase family protein [Flavobacteriaceae bacterium]
MRIHFIAIGGSAMHNLALALHHKGYEVSGSDDVIFEPSKSRLAAARLLPEKMGWFPERIHIDLDAVILGMHAKEDNEELQKAQKLGLKIYSYPEFLYEQSRDKTRVVIGGSHGKTTITSMILHVLNYYDIKVDYMVGAQLEGFDRMVHLTEDNDFIVLEGDEYLSSPIDRRPKFHLYQPHIALLSGIAWDHINVFPTYENYLEQFRIFVDSIIEGGSITFNEEDDEVLKIVNESSNSIRRIPYNTHQYSVDQGQSYLETTEGPLPVQIFGQHNISNLSGAKWICQHMGVDEDDFYQAIASFQGASKRLEKIAESKDSIIYKDFAHSPSKVGATTNAVKEQYPDRKLVACLELHTYSSLNTEFLKEYENTMSSADVAVVFYSPEALRIKRLEALSKEQIIKAFQRDDLQIFTNPRNFTSFLEQLEYNNVVLLLMSSGNYGGIELHRLFDGLFG